MTKLAKILIFVNLALGVMFAAWALGVFTQRFDWGTTKASETKLAGEIAKRTDEFTRLKEALDRAGRRYFDARKTLQVDEPQLAQDQVWYAQQLQALDDGPVARTVVYDKGILRFDPATRRPVLQNMTDKAGKPIPAVRGLLAQERQVQRDIAAEMKELDNLVEREKALTVQLIGDGAQIKGLRPQLAAQRQEGQNSLREQEHLEWLLYNRLVDLSLVKKRQTGLEARSRELSGVAARQP